MGLMVCLNLLFDLRLRSCLIFHIDDYVVIALFADSFDASSRMGSDRLR